MPFILSLLLATYPYSHKPGTIRMINWWAMWCDACKIELKEFSGQIPGNVNLILIEEDEKTEAGEAWLKENFKGTYTLMADPDHEIADHFKLESFPTTYVVDKADHIVFEQGGYKAEESTKRILDFLTSKN